jgi:hypothetical protein
MQGIASLIFVGFFISACSGTVVMSPLSAEAIKHKYEYRGNTPENEYEKDRDIKGIIVYRAIPLIQVDMLTQINLTDDPKSPAVLSNDCIHTAIRKVVSIPDWEHPYRLHYDHGLLESYTFAATLNSDGILVGINTLSAPDQGKTFQNVVGPLASAAATLKFDGTRPCTITPVFVGYEKLPDQEFVPPFKTLCPGGVCP